MRLFQVPASFRYLIASACILGAATAVVVADLVQRPTAEVLDAKGSAGDVIETVKKGGTLEIVEKGDPWLKVRTPSGKVGYVSKAVFQAGSGGTDLTGAQGSTTASPTEASAAGRGDFDPEVSSYAASKHIDPTALLKMQEMRRNCRGKPLRNFQKKGDIGVK